jgi:hypothetical protein
MTDLESDTSLCSPNPVESAARSDRRSSDSFRSRPSFDHTKKKAVEENGRATVAPP